MTNVERSEARLQISVPVLVVGVENAVPVIIFVMDVQNTIIVVILIVNMVPAQTFPQCTAVSHNPNRRAVNEASRSFLSAQRRSLLGASLC